MSSPITIYTKDSKHYVRISDITGKNKIHASFDKVGTVSTLFGNTSAICNINRAKSIELNHLVYFLKHTKSPLNQEQLPELPPVGNEITRHELRSLDFISDTDQRVDIIEIEHSDSETESENISEESQMNHTVKNTDILFLDDMLSLCLHWNDADKVISFCFDENEEVELFMRGTDSSLIPLPDHYKTTPVITHEWNLQCSFPEGSFENSVQWVYIRSAEYTMRFDGTETIEDVLGAIRALPSCGYFQGFTAIDEKNYVLSWGC